MTCTHVCPVGMSRMSCVVAGTLCKVARVMPPAHFSPTRDATRTRTIARPRGSTLRDPEGVDGNIHTNSGLEL